MISILLYLIAIVKYILAGSIESYDLELDYSNLGYTSMYKMTFKVETNFLDENNDAIRIIFPSPIHDPTKDLLQQITSAQLSYFDKSTPPTTVTLNAKKMRYDSKGRYYFLFNYLLDNTITYTLTITATALGEQVHTKLLTGDSVVEIETIMHYDSDNSFIYDFNPIYGVLRYTQPPERNIQFSVDATVSDFAFKPGGVYPVFFTIITTKVYYGSMKFEISYINPDFQLTQFCYSVKSGLITALEPSLYSCFFSNNKLVFEYFGEVIPQNFAIRIASIGQNANRVTKGIGFALRAILKDGSHITDEILKENMFDLQQIYLSKTSVQIAHGIPVDTSISPSFLLCLFRNSKPTSKGQLIGQSSIFNAIKFFFQLNQETPIGQELELQFLVPSSKDTDYDSYVLLQSITENFPNYSDSQKVQCTVINNLISTKNRFIRCINVGQLAPSKDYHLGFRFYLAYEESFTSMPNNFSQLNIMTVSYDSQKNRIIDSINLNVQQTITKAVLRTVNSNNWSYSYYNQTVVSTQDYDTNTKAAQFKRPYQAGGTLGIQISDKPKKLIFSLDIPNAELTNVPMDIPQDVPLSAGVYIVCNPKIVFNTNTEINSYSLLNQNISHSISYASNLFTQVQVKASHTDALSKLFTRNDFSITSATINFRTTPYVLDTLLDFYILSYDQFLSDTPTLFGQILVNAYTVDFDLPNTSYKLAVINQYKGKDFGNQPSVIPTLLKVSIQFSSGDISAGNKGFIIFFDGASFIDDTLNNQENLSTPQIIECGTTITDQTVSYKGYRTIQMTPSLLVNHGLIYQNMNQLIISPTTLSSGNQITVLIPLKLNQYSDQMHVYISTIQLNLDYKILQKDNYFTYDKIYRLSASSKNLIESDNDIKRRLIFGNQLNSLTNFPTSTNFQDITKSSIQLNIGDLKIGSQSNMLVDLKFTDKDSTYYYQNDDTKTFLQGSAFTFIASWKFFQSQTDQDCIFFNFNFKKILSDNSFKIQTRYIMYCPLQSTDTTTQTLTINKFNLPSKANETPDDTTFSISNSRGYLRYALQLKQSINSANELTVSTSNGKLFWGSVDNLFVYQISQSYSSIPLEKGMKVRIALDFKKTYIIPGKQCLFYDPEKNIYEQACQVLYDPNNSNQIDFLLLDSCSTCSFTKFQLYHYGNQIVSDVDRENDKTFKVQLCIHFSTNGCLLLAQTSSQLTYKFENDAIVIPKKLNIQSYQLKFLPETKNQMSEIGLRFGFTYQNIDSILFNANIYDRIIINLGTFGIFNQQLFDSSIITRICRVYSDNGDGTASTTTLFSSLEIIDSNQGKSFLINVKKDLRDTNLFIFKCQNVQFPDKALILPINIQVKDYTFQNIYQQSDDYNFNSPFKQTKQFALGFPIISSIINNSQGSIATIHFQIKTQSTKTLNNASTIYIKYPYNYNIKKITKYPLACKINSISVDAFVEEDNLLRISGIPQQTQNILEVAISGVRMPKYNKYSTFSFKVVFDYQNADDTEEGIAYPLPPTQIQTLPLIINSMQLQNTIIDRLSMYTFFLTVNSTQVTPQTYFQINFPRIWQINNEETVSQCLVKDISLDIILGQFCRREGSTAIFKIYYGGSSSSSTVSNSLSTIQLSITNINNPEQWDSNIIYTKPSVSLIDSVTGATIYFGDSYVMNSEKINFQKQEDRQYLGWFNQNGEQILEVEAINGVYNTQIFLRPIDTTKVFEGELSISLSETSLQKLSIYPNLVVSQIGDQQLSLFIGGNSDTREGQYIATFYKNTDTFNLYSNIPSLRINLKNTQVSLQFSIQKLKLPLLGTSPPIILDLSMNRLMDSITIKPKDNSSITVIKGQSMQFNQYTDKQTFQFQVSDQIQDSGFQVEFIITGVGEKFILADNKISVEIDKIGQQFTKLLISKDITKAGTTYYPIDFTCSVQGIIYYRLSLKTEPPVSLDIIKEKAISQYQDIQDKFNLIEKYGYVLSNSVKSTVMMTNLISLQYYKVEGFCETFKGEQSDKNNLDFQTTDNNSQLNQLTLTFSSVLSMTQKRKLCCVISDFLTIPSSLIYLREGIKCKDSQLRISFINPSPIVKESLGKISIYISPLNYLKDQNQFNYMIAAIKNKDNFKSYLQSNVQNLPNIDSISEIASIDYPQVSFDLTKPDQIQPGINNVTISYLKLSQNGFIYLALEELSGQSIKPDASQLKRGVNYQGTVFKNGMQVVYQNDKVYKQSLFYFDQLKNNTHYIIYFMGGSEYQDELSTYTEVFTRQFQTQNSQDSLIIFESTTALLLQFSTLAVFLLMLIN